MSLYTKSLWLIT